MSMYPTNVRYHNYRKNKHLYLHNSEIFHRIDWNLFPKYANT